MYNSVICGKKAVCPLSVKWILYIRSSFWDQSNSVRISSLLGKVKTLWICGLLGPRQFTQFTYISSRLKLKAFYEIIQCNDTVIRNICSELGKHNENSAVGFILFILLLTTEDRLHTQLSHLQLKAQMFVHLKMTVSCATWSHRKWPLSKRCLLPPLPGWLVVSTFVTSVNEISRQVFKWLFFSLS